MTDNPSFKKFLYAERSLALAGNRNVSLLAEFGVVLATVLVLLRSFDWQPVVVWALIAELASLYSWYTHRNAGKQRESKTKTRDLNYMVLGTWLVATLWGLVPVFFFDREDIILVIFMVCLYAGYVSGALAVTIAYSRSFIAFALGITVPFIGRLLYEGDDLCTMIALLMVFYTSMLTYVSMNLQSLFVSNARSSYENEELILQLRHEKLVAENATQAKSKFLASASHDLRQPIHAANLFLDILKPLQTEPKNRQILDKVTQSMQGLNKMLHGLLDISRLDAGTVENEPQDVSLNKIINPLIEEQRAGLTDVKIQNFLGNEFSVHADPVIVERIVRNLLDNAVKYTKRGNIKMSASEAGDKVLLTIRDSGIGIPNDKLSSIFDEFTQLNNPERNRQKGLGLGLAIVKRLCTLAQFDISIISEEGHGTTVELLLPSGNGNEQTAPDHSEKNLFGLRILVIDDEADIREGMQTLLEQWGCQVLVAEDKATADKLLADNDFTPKVLIADFRLRNDESGLDAIDQYRKHFGEGLITILITGDTAPERVYEASKSGAKVIYKPLDGATLRSSIQKLLMTKG